MGTGILIVPLIILFHYIADKNDRNKGNRECKEYEEDQKRRLGL